LAQDLALVDEEAGELTGTVFGTYDGTRGWVHRLATRPDRRGRGIASALLAELERRLRAAGCPKVNLLIEPDHAAWPASTPDTATGPTTTCSSAGTRPPAPWPYSASSEPATWRLVVR
jgi:GNAT superfamily N-acetyltransferase